MGIVGWEKIQIHCEWVCCWSSFTFEGMKYCEAKIMYAVMLTEAVEIRITRFTNAINRDRSNIIINFLDLVGTPAVAAESHFPTTLGIYQIFCKKLWNIPFYSSFGMRRLGRSLLGHILRLRINLRITNAQINWVGMPRKQMRHATPTTIILQDRESANARGSVATLST